jgi:outer membrane protein
MGNKASPDLAIPVNVDPIATSLRALSQYEKINLNEDDLNRHPLLKMHAATAESYRLSADSLSSNLLPKLSLFAKTSIDYPNGPILEKINQNTIGVALTMPLFEGSRSTNESFEKQNQMKAFENRREQARTDLLRDWHKASDQLKGLRDKIDIFYKSVNESEERAKLVYSSYRIGRSNFIEVQSANLYALEAKVQSTTNDVQILIQLAYLASISEEQSQ